MNYSSRETIGKFLQDLYAFPICSVGRLERSEASGRFLVSLEDGRKILVKQSHWYDFTSRPERILEKVHALGNEIKKHFPRLQAAYPSLSGRFCLLQDGLPTLVLPYFVGSDFAGTERDLAAAGRALASFHLAGLEFLKRKAGEYENIRKMIPVEKPYEESVIIYKDYFRRILAKSHDCAEKSICDSIRQHLPLIDNTIDFVEEYFSAAGRWTHGIIHTDFNFGNVIYGEDGEAFVLDIDLLNVGLLGEDIGTALVSFLLALKKKGRSDLSDIALTFLRAYHRVNPLSAADYLLILPSIQKNTIARILRIMRRHHFENNRLPEMMKKIPDRFLKRLIDSPREFSFLTEDWLTNVWQT
jgi:Ser/Thr protein kinase RdoA (MazF antagonist)